MAKNKENYKEMKKEELIKIVDEVKKELKQMRFDRVLGSTFNLVDFKKTKKKLSRVLTALSESKLGELSKGGSK
jgi:ribosomal protein L29